MLKLSELYRIDEMARKREDAMWAVLDWAAQQHGEFTIKDMYREWAKAGGGGDNASYQQFSTAINNYIYKYDPQSPTAKYRNPRYKYIRVGKTDKGTVPAPLQFVTKGSRGAGGQHVLRWRPGVPMMRQPAPPKAALAPEGDPTGDALDKLERKLGRPALKAALQRWRQLGDLHKISADIMGDVQIRGKDKMLALQVAASNLVSTGKATAKQADASESEMEDEVGAPATPFSHSEPEETGFDDDEKTDPDANPLGAQGQSEPDSDDELPDDLLHGDDGGEPEGHGEEEPGGDGSESDAEEDSSPEGAQLPVLLRKGDRVLSGQFTWGGGSWNEGSGTVTDSTGRAYGPKDGWQVQVQGEDFYGRQYEGMLLWLSETWGELDLDPESEGGPSLSAGEDSGSEPESEAGDGTMRGTLVGEDGRRIPVTIQYDEDEGATVMGANGESIGPYEHEGYSLEVANGVLTQDAFDDLEDDGWDLVAAADGEDETEGDAPDAEDDEDEATGEETEDPESGSSPGGGGRPSDLPEPNEDGSTAEYSMYRLVDEAGIDEDDPLFDQFRRAKNSLDVNSILARSQVPKNLWRAALIVAREIFARNHRDWDTGQPLRGQRSESSSLLRAYGISESPLEEPLDFDQTSGLKRAFGWRRSR